jgi:hypothetical protein
MVPFMKPPDSIRAEFSPTHFGDSIRYDPANAGVDAVIEADVRHVFPPMSPVRAAHQTMFAGGL